MDKIDNLTPQQNIVTWLLTHQVPVKIMIMEFTKQKDELIAKEDHIFHKDIKEQYFKLVKQKIAFEIAKDLAISAEQIYTVIEALNVEEYLNV